MGLGRTLRASALGNVDRTVFSVRAHRNGDGGSGGEGGGPRAWGTAAVAPPGRSSAYDWVGGILRRFPVSGYRRRAGIVKDSGLFGVQALGQVPRRRRTSDMLALAWPSTAIADFWMIWFRVSIAVSVA